MFVSKLKIHCRQLSFFYLPVKILEQRISVAYSFACFAFVVLTVILTSMLLEIGKYLVCDLCIGSSLTYRFANAKFKLILVETWNFRF